MGYNDPVRTKKGPEMAFVILLLKTVIALSVFATLLAVLLITGILSAIF